MFRLSEVGKFIVGAVASAFILGFCIPFLYGPKHPGQLITIGVHLGLLLVVMVISVPVQQLAKHQSNLGNHLLSSVLYFGQILSVLAIGVNVGAVTGTETAGLFSVLVCILYPTVLRKALAADKAKQLSPTPR